MSKVLSKVLSLDRNVESGCDHYIDDIIVDLDKVSVDVVRDHLAKYGLVTKEPDSLINARVLGLRVRQGEVGRLVWRRDNDIGEFDAVATKRDLFSLCGRLTGHYPVAGWLRLACSFMKRQASDCDWDNAIPTAVEGMVQETKS